MNVFASEFGTVSLRRYPARKDDRLQAYDAADAYLLADAHSRDLREGAEILVVNDGFGALATPLADRYRVTVLTDSYLSRLAVQQNLSANSVHTAVRFITDPAELPDVRYDAILIRVPKALSLLENQLIGLRPRVAPGSYVAAGAMIKHLPRAAGDLLQKYVGDVQASLGVRKARLLRATPREDPPSLAPVPPATYRIDDPPLELSNYPGVFARDHLDLGTRALLPHLPSGLGAAEVVDLGCGNGVLGIVSALANPDARYTLLDESYAALDSARLNWSRHLPGRGVEVHAADGLVDAIPESVDVVICNPPFHQSHVVGDTLAWRMFTQAQQALRPGGELYVVGNRHLGYHSRLRRVFRDVEQLGGTNRFVVLRARR